MNASKFLPALALAALAAPGFAQPTQPAAPAQPTAPRALTADEQVTLRCSAAFAIVAAGQARGQSAATRYPPLGPRGREFFVRNAARLMDDAGLDQAALKAAVGAEAAALQRGGIDQVMPLCLQLLDATERTAR